jgi:hypothetical protein
MPLNDRGISDYTKARRTAYSLLSAGFHGVNGLDPMTSLSLYKTYIQPVLTYGLEIVQPKQSNLAKLELFQKLYSNRSFHFQLIHQILRLISYLDYYQ